MELDLITNFAPPFIIALLACFISLLGLVPLAKKIQLIDNPNNRSSHTTPTPRIGGVGIVIGIVAGLLFCGSLTPKTWTAIGIFSPIVIMGLLDDKFNLPASIRFAIHFIVSFLLIYILQIYPQSISIPYLTLTAPTWLMISCAVLFLVSFLNFFNFMDGINGIATFQASLGVLGFTALFAVHGIISGNIITIFAAIIGACIRFLPLIFRKSLDPLGFIFLLNERSAQSLQA